ncbi:MAG TPA: hypothetical protein VE684_22460, partial [Crenalkalicoccus sp.]|nr:hypothetical protein [Crenalkalicoccus sp.]
MLLLAAGLAMPGAASARHRQAARPPAPDATLPSDTAELLPAPTRLAMPASPRAACLVAARRAEAVHGLPPGLLVAIALSESGLHANALSIGGRAAFPEDRAEARRLLLSAPAALPVMAG